MIPVVLLWRICKGTPILEVLQICFCAAVSHAVAALAVETELSSDCWRVLRFVV